MPSADLRDRLQSALGDAYRIERELAPGGMSRLFLATERSLDRQVVIKLLPPEYASEISAARFQREVTLTAHLQHPHILPILSAGSKDGLLYYVMPYVEGESLRQRLEREGKLPVGRAVRIITEVADALARAHRAGIVHRDIKPENILLQDDHAMLADFGVARALHEATGGQRLTETGMGLGTPGYMAPEQLAGDQKVDARADVYALAVVGYEMLAGVAPFTGPTPQAAAAAHFTVAPKPLVRLRPDVPRPVSDAIATALANAPDERFKTAAEFRDALGTDGQRLGGRSARSTKWVVATTIILVITAAATFGRWRVRAGATTDAMGPIRLAVLPFDNLGDSGDAYFADGVTDAVRGKLTSIPGLEVIAPASSAQYRKTTKTPQQIGQELGVRYLLVGKVRWAKAPGTPGRVEVSPALVEASSAADKWERPFDAPLTDVFQVQADIADKVAQQLQVTLSPTARQTLDQRPTTNLDAYDVYLRGREAQRSGFASGTQRRAAALYQEAVRRDSTFALAWAALATAHAGIYSAGVPTPADAEAVRVAAARSLALAPDLPEAHAAQAAYYGIVRADYVRALAEVQTGLRLSPNNALLLRLAGNTERALGRWDQAIALIEQSARLDPRNGPAARALGFDYLYVRRYSDARTALDHAVALEPANPVGIESRAMVELAQGNLTGARAIIRAASPAVDAPTVTAYVAKYNDLVWVLDSAQQRLLLTLPPSAFDNDRAGWALGAAQAYALRGDRTPMRAYADSARLAFETQLRATPNDPQLHVLHGVVLAYLGRPGEAVAEGERGVALGPISADAANGPYYQHQLVRIYMLVGEPGKALDKLEPLLKVPYYLSPGWLRIDPNFAPLRGNPRFQRLIAQPNSGAQPTA